MPSMNVELIGGVLIMHNAIEQYSAGTPGREITHYNQDLNDSALDATLVLPTLAFLHNCAALPGLLKLANSATIVVNSITLPA